MSKFILRCFQVVFDHRFTLKNPQLDIFREKYDDIFYKSNFDILKEKTLQNRQVLYLLENFGTMPYGVILFLRIASFHLVEFGFRTTLVVSG